MKKLHDLYYPMLANLAIARGVAADPNIDERDRARRLIFLCREIVQQMDILHEILDDIERLRPSFRDKVNNIRIQLRTLKLDFQKLMLELNLDII